MKKIVVLTALAVVVTSFGIDPSHARRRLSISSAKANPAPATRPMSATKQAPVTAPRRAPAAAASGQKNDGRTGTQVFVTPGLAVRPSGGATAAASPTALTAPMDAGASAVIAGVDAPAVHPAPAAAPKPATPPAPAAPVRKHFVDLNPMPAPAQPQRTAGATPPRQTVLCFKTASGQCGRIE